MAQRWDAVLKRAGPARRLHIPKAGAVVKSLGSRRDCRREALRTVRGGWARTGCAVGPHGAQAKSAMPLAAPIPHAQPRAWGQPAFGFQQRGPKRPRRPGPGSGLQWGHFLPRLSPRPIPARSKLLVPFLMGKQHSLGRISVIYNSWASLRTLSNKTHSDFFERNAWTLLRSCGFDAPAAADGKSPHAPRLFLIICFAVGL